MIAVRTLTTLLAIGLAACGPGAPERGGDEPPRLPAVLHRLLLNEGNDEISPVTYGHLFHLDEAAMGRKMACTDCHHHLADDPGGIPVACATCHPHEEGDPRSTNVPAGGEGKAPDL